MLYKQTCADALLEKGATPTRNKSVRKCEDLAAGGALNHSTPQDQLMKMTYKTNGALTGVLLAPDSMPGVSTVVVAMVAVDMFRPSSDIGVRVVNKVSAGVATMFFAETIDVFCSSSAMGAAAVNEVVPGAVKMVVVAIVVFFPISAIGSGNVGDVVLGAAAMVVVAPDVI